MAQQLIHEHAHLSDLYHPAFPRPIHCMVRDGFTATVRAYVPGQSLAEYSESRALSCAEVLGIAEQVCRIVLMLHQKVPPIVHRDLSPSNFIRRKDGSIALVDLDAAHVEDLEKRGDIIHLGTIGIAAPEQYGVKRSDVRADIYGVGALMTYLFTNDYDVTLLQKQKVPARLVRVIRRCMQFDPKRRYASVQALLREIERLRHPVRVGLRRTTMAALFCMMLAGAYWGINHFSILPFVLVRFPNEAIAQAVAEQLGKLPETIRYRDLQQVEALYLCGNQPYGNWDEVSSYGLDNIQSSTLAWTGEHGALSDLSFFRHLPNLHSLALLAQDIRDIAPLGDLPLKRLSLSNNPVSDLSPLAKADSLRVLDINATFVSDLSPLSNDAQLAELRIKDALVRDITPLTFLSLTSLHCSSDNLSLNPDALTKLSSLRLLWITDIRPADIPRIAALTGLEMLFFDPPLDTLEPLLPLTALTDLSMGGTTLRSLAGIERFTRLDRLSLNNTYPLDLSPLKAHGSLQYLDLFNAPDPIWKSSKPFPSCGSLPSARSSWSRCCRCPTPFPSG